MPGAAGTESQIKPGHFTLSTGWRDVRADTYYFYARPYNSANVLERPTRAWDTLDVTGTYQVSDRVNIALQMPININRASFLEPATHSPIEFRQSLRARSVGDISLIARSWLLKPKEHPKGNILLGAGLRFPTGNFREKATYSDFTGRNIAALTVPLTIMPGDGGLDVILEALAYRAVKVPCKGTIAFAQANYLIAPRGTNGVPSQVATSGNPEWFLNPAVLRNDANYNTVPDAYSIRTGIIGPVLPKRKWANGLQWQLAYRWDGSPQHDLFGSSKGFRQPGYFMAAEPGLFYQRKKHLWQLSVPISFLRVALPDLAQKQGSPDPRTTAFAPASVSLRYTYNF